MEALIDDGVNAYGTRTQLHISTDTVIEKKTYDAEPILLACEQARQATEGQRWGEGKIVGKVPMSVFAQCVHMDAADQHKFLKSWLIENSKFQTYHRPL